jgi:hypothetical protein
MARKVTGGRVGEPSVGAINVSPTANFTTATNLDIAVSPAGTGRFVINSNSQLNAQSSLRFGDADSSNYVAFRAPTTISSDVTWTLPATDGLADQVLSTDASGNLVWTTKTVIITDQILSSTPHYPLLSTATSGTASSVNTSSTKLSYTPSTGGLTAGSLTATTGGLTVSLGGASINGNTAVAGTVSATSFFLNGTTISTSYTVASGTNAVSAGPITIASGVTVTVTGDWSVV